MKNKKNITILVVIIILITSGYLFTLYLSDVKLKKEGNAIVEKIENYRQVNNHLPNSLNDIGIEETEKGPWFYEKKSETEYNLLYPIGFDKSKQYFSKTKTWKDLPE